MPVSNPLYQRIAGIHPAFDPATGEPLRPKIPIQALQEFIFALAVSNRTTADAAAFHALVAEVAGVGLDQTETDQVNDLVATVSGNTAARTDRILRIRSVLEVLEMGGTITGYTPDDMAGTAATAGGKLDVIRRDGP